MLQKLLRTALVAGLLLFGFAVVVTATSVPEYTQAECEALGRVYVEGGAFAGSCARDQEELEEWYTSE